MSNLPSPATGPLVSAPLPLLSLIDSYSGNDESSASSFVPMLTSIAKDYPSYRAVRGDGSCAYR
jgi:hypothetical protein